MSEAVDGLTKLFIALIAYIAPYFLIPLTFKYGLGVFGNLAGMVNDRSRGVFDKQRKYRQDTKATNHQKAKAGELYNNRGLNALTSRASTKNFGFGARGSQAYQQKISNASYDFGKTAQGQAVQHNDDALRALTYGSEAQAKANMLKDFGMDDAKIDTAVAAARAAGGFGRNRQVWAANQLAATGTGYDNLEQVGATIARAANGNASQAAAMAGNINAATKGVGRSDLAPGFGNLNKMALAEMTGKITNASGQELDFKNETIRKQQYHAATLAATESQDAMTLLRGKNPGVKNILSSLKSELATNPQNTSATSTVHDLINSMAYGPQPNQQSLIETFGSDPVFAEHIRQSLELQRRAPVPRDPADPNNGLI